MVFVQGSSVSSFSFVIRVLQVNSLGVKMYLLCLVGRHISCLQSVKQKARFMSSEQRVFLIVQFLLCSNFKLWQTLKEAFAIVLLCGRKYASLD